MAKQAHWEYCDCDLEGEVPTEKCRNETMILYNARQSVKSHEIKLVQAVRAHVVNFAHQHGWYETNRELGEIRIALANLDEANENLRKVENGSND